MAKKEELDSANNGSPAADIPDLKKKEKERKKAGTAWSGAKPGGGPFSGATGGTVARASASAASASGGAAAGSFGVGSIISRLAVTLVGKLILGVSAAAILMGGGLVGYGLLKGGSAAGTGAIGDLGALSSSLKVRMGGGDRTGYVASKGELRFDPIKAAEPQKATAAPEDKAPAGDAAPAQTADAAKSSDFNRPGLEHNMNGTKLSSSLGGDFGSKNIMSASGSSKLSQTMGKFAIKAGEKGRLSDKRAGGRTGKLTAGASRQGGKANKAFGQLKNARGASMLGANSTGAEGASNLAATAFDGGNVTASNVDGGPGIGSGTPQNPGDSGGNGSGAPDMTAPTPHEGFNQQAAMTAAMLAAIAKMAADARKMKEDGQNMIYLGLALIAAGCFVWTAFLIPIGVALVAMGYMMMQQADMMKGIADAMSASLAAANTDQNQNNINQYCIEQVYTNGTPVASCNPPASVTGVHDFESADAEGRIHNERIIREDGHVENDPGGPTP